MLRGGARSVKGVRNLYSSSLSTSSSGLYTGTGAVMSGNGNAVMGLDGV